MTGTRRRSIAALVAVGAVAITLGVLYLSLRANALPPLLGQLHTHAHRTKRGLAALGLGLLLWAGASALSVPRQRPHHHAHSHSHDGAKTHHSDGAASMGGA
jgi:hypothetical protein